jgi:hypothetical protein
MMNRFLLFCLILLLCTVSTSAQPVIDLDKLPNCNFSQEGLQVGAVVVDLTTGRGCAEGLDTPMQIASVPKIFVMGAFLLEVARGNLDFETTMPFTYDYYMGGRNACMSADMIGADVTYGYLSDIMITCSDNSATWMLMDVMGWETVQEYIDGLGIEGISEVIPYSEVDRLKLTSIDERWANVPRGLASQFLRTRSTGGLVPNYFSREPNYSREQRIEANRYYFENYTYNMATPRAIVEYILKLQGDLIRPNEPEGQAAYWFFNTMILTQRQYSAQAQPGTVYVGAKNGFDMGLRAELNLIFPSLWTLSPGAIALVFAQQDTLSPEDFDEFGRARTEGLTETLSELSPQITAMLYPNLQAPSVRPDNMMTSIVFHDGIEINLCAQADRSLDQIENCWESLDEPELRVGQQLGMGLILRRMENRTQRFTFIYTAPNREQYSYQYTIAERDDTHLFWFHPLDLEGEWTIDLYQNLQHVHSETVTVIR